MAKKVECLKVEQELFEIGDIVEIKVSKNDSISTYKGRIAGFTERGPKCPPDQYVKLDMSEKFKTKTIDLEITQIQSVRKVKKY